MAVESERVQGKGGRRAGTDLERLPILSLKEIEALYPNQWVTIWLTEHGQALDDHKGRVIAHSQHLAGLTPAYRRFRARYLHEMLMDYHTSIRQPVAPEDMLIVGR